MAQNTILHQIRDLINNAGLALEDALEQIVPGADPTYWRRLLDRAEETQNLASRQPRKTTRRRSSGSQKPRKSTNYANQVAGRAMAEMVQTQNLASPPAGRAPHGEEPDSATRAILINANGRFHGILEVR